MELLPIVDVKEHAMSCPIAWSSPSTSITLLAVARGYLALHEDEHSACERRHTYNVQLARVSHFHDGLDLAMTTSTNEYPGLFKDLDTAFGCCIRGLPALRALIGISCIVGVDRMNRRCSNLLSGLDLVLEAIHFIGRDQERALECAFVCMP